MNIWAKSWSVVMVFSSGLSVYAADTKIQEEHDTLIKMMQEVPIAQMEIYHSHDWQDFMKISQSHWGDSTVSLTEKFDSIIGEKGTFTQFYSRVFKDSKSLHLLQKAYVGWQCLKLITHFNTHSKGSVVGWFRAPYEIDVITKLELYAIQKDIPLSHCYHQQLGYNASDFSGIERMNEELIKKLEQQEEEERRIKDEEEEQRRLASISVAPVLDFKPKRHVSQKTDNPAGQNAISSLVDAKKVDISKTKGAVQTLSLEQLQEVLNKKLKHVLPEDLIRPIPETGFSFMLKAVTARRPQIEGNDLLSDEKDDSDFD
jgi:hypothetical protein